MCMILIRSPLPNIVTKFYVYDSYSLSSDKYSHQVYVYDSYSLSSAK